MSGPATNSIPSSKTPLSLNSTHPNYAPLCAATSSRDCTHDLPTEAHSIDEYSRGTLKCEWLTKMLPAPGGLQRHESYDEYKSHLRNTRETQWKDYEQTFRAKEDLKEQKRKAKKGDRQRLQTAIDRYVVELRNHPITTTDQELRACDKLDSALTGQGSQ